MKKESFYQRVPIEDFLLDFLLIGLGYYGFETVSIWFETHLWWGYYGIGLLQLLAFGGAVAAQFWTYPVVSIKDEGEEGFWGQIMWGVTGLSFVLAIGGVFWLMVPALAIEQVYGSFPAYAGWYLLGLIFAAWIVLGIVLESLELRERVDRQKYYLWIRLGSAFLIGLYLFLSESLILASVRVADVDGELLAAGIGTAIISYLPLRLTLALRAPHTPWELFSILAAFTFFIGRLAGWF